MTSMSYCMFENTSSELAQVTNAMRESGDWEELDLNQYEEDAKNYLYTLCKRYIREFDRLNEGGDDE